MVYVVADLAVSVSVVVAEIAVDDAVGGAFFDFVTVSVNHF
jgi:hypothetical protein